MPSLGVSLAAHAALLLVLALIGHAASSRGGPLELSGARLPETKDFATFDVTAVADIDNTDVMPVAGSFAPETSAFLAERYDPSSRAAVPNPDAPPTVPTPPDLKPADVVEVAGMALPKPTKLDLAVSIRGTGAEHVGGVEGAVDRVAVEILRRLESGPTLVVWAFDASGSLYAERQRLADYIANVYEHIDTLDQGGLAQHEGLLTAVLAFGANRQAMTEKPTADRSEIAAAIRAVPLDRTGTETSFRTTMEAAGRYGRYKRGGQVYQPMLVIVTDEAGDDEDALEPAIRAASTAKMPVYVLGSSALLGRIEGYMSFTDPETGDTYDNAPVHQGCDTAALEGIRLPFWFDGPQYDLIDAGFGPYGLSRLAGATGGIYFITRLGDRAMHFDPDGLSEYKPDWISKDQYLQMMRKSPLRRAVMRAGQVTQQRLPGMPSFQFPALEDPGFKDVMTRNQEIVARTQYTVDEALGASNAGPGDATILSVEKLRDHEPSRRWRAQYDLVRGRLLAMRIRCKEFNEAGARLKKDPPKFTKPNSNAWRLVPDEEVHLKGKDVEQAKEARVLLRRVIDEHPGTPWALLAQRELKDPLGLKWVEHYVAPPPPPGNDNGNNNPPPRRQRRERPPAPPKI